jgi:hypothetical protein
VHHVRLRIAGLSWGPNLRLSNKNAWTIEGRQGLVNDRIFELLGA